MFDRAIARTRLDLRRGLWVLGTFARVILPLGSLGMFAMLWHRLHADWHCCFCSLYGEGGAGANEAFVPFALGLFLSVIFRLSHHALDSWCLSLCRQLD